MANSGSTYQRPAGSSVWFTLGLLCFAALLALAGIFFRERIAFCDTAYQAVYLLIEQKPWVNWFRPGSIIPQFVPLAAIWLHADLKTVMILHSLSFILFYLAVYLVCYRYSRKTLLFFLAPLYLTLITNEVFYWPQSELQQGMLWLCLYAVLLYEGSFDKFSLLISSVLHFLFLFWIQSFHPLIFFPIVLLIIYYYGTWQSLFSRQSITHIIVAGAAFVSRFLIGILSPYERGKLDIGNAIRENLPHFISLPSVHAFIHHLPTYYAVYTLVMLAATGWLLWHRQYLKAFALVAISFAYWVLVMISSPPDVRFYTENMLLPLAFIAAFPLVVDMLPAYPLRYTATAAALIIAMRLAGIYSVHTDYTAHYAAYDPYIAIARDRKLNGLFVDEKLVNQQQAIITWASGYETMLTTSLQSPDSCRIIQVDPDPDHYSYALGMDTAAVTCYGIWGKTQLPPRYFKLQGGRYEIIH
ncbi:MAG: hypothetical protein JST83_06435 [Bacteroidetes bacterium]|nr:hypothetical protein [Bacteroidota bacterium]